MEIIYYLVMNGHDLYQGISSALDISYVIEYMIG